MQIVFEKLDFEKIEHFVIALTAVVSLSLTAIELVWMKLIKWFQ